MHPFLRKEASGATSYDNKFLIFDVMQCYQRPSLMPSHPQHGHPQARKRSVGPASPPVHSEAEFDTSAHPASLIEQAQALPTSAAPGDDQRFAVWAVRSEKNDGTFLVSNRFGQTDEEQSSEHASPANKSPTFTTKRRKRRSPLPFGDRSTANDDSSASVPPANAASSTKGKAMLLAASAARLVAELTAEIDLDLRRDFFYTYREFMTPADLLELLILRFEWAVSQPSSVEDEARRRIVRVRTYVVLKHWLQHHFDFDFLPDRALRQRLATWLNSIAKDERVTKRPADLNIVNSLRKIVRGLKETYSQSGVGGLLLHDAGRVVDTKTSSVSTFGSSSHDSDPGGGTSSSTRSDKEVGMTSSVSGSSITEDVDLDFNEDQSSLDSPQIRSPPTQHSQRSSGEARGDPSDAMLAAAQKASAESVLVSHRHTLAPSSLQQSRSQAPAASSSPFALPHTSNAWSRAVVHTVGRLSKFKRAIGARGMGMDSHPELDSEAEECSDLLFAKGGLDSLLQYFAAEQARRQSLAASRMSRIPQQRPLPRTEEADEEEEGLASQASEDSTGQEETPSLAGASTNRSTPASSIDLTVLSDQHASHGHQSAHGLGIGIGQREHAGSDFSTATHGHDALRLDSTRMQPLSSLVRAKAEGEDHLHHATSEQTLRSVSRMPVEQSSQESAPMTRTSVRRGPSTRDSVLSNGAPRIVQIDDIDLSSDEDDFAVRKALRRLPGARDLRQANTIKDLEPHQQLQSGRESVDSMASSMFRHPGAPHRLQMGSFSHGHARGVSVDSALFLPGQLGSMHLAAPAAPPVITTVQSEMLDPDEALQGYELVKGFRLDDIESDDEEPGGVEAALLRLEGIIDEDRQKAKAKRVERMWQRSMARNAKKDALGDSQDSVVTRRSQASLRSQGDRTWSSSLTGGSLADVEDAASIASVHPCDLSVDGSLQKHAKPMAHHQPRIRPQASFLDLQDGSSASESGEHEERSQATVPQEESQQPSAEAFSSSRPLDAAGIDATPAQRSAAIHASRQAASPTKTPQPVPGRLLSPKAGLAAPLPSHRSFLLSYRTESVARQMCLIEAELLRSVSWDELASPRWRERRYGAEVTDWEAFYRDRVRDRLEAQRQGEVYHERAVEAIVARFNLTSNWVASEIVLTHNLEERAAVICKLIRVAWKCYLQSNFASLAQIIFGLSTPWVQRLRRTWSRVGYFEMRMWRDLNSFVGPRHNFRHLRNAMLQLAESSAGESGPGASSAGSMATEAAQSAPTRGCIPFFGLFVSDLMQYDSMPTLLDPTSPTMAATTTTLAADGKVRLYPANPHAFADLAPLPPGVQLEPLVNMLKFRNVAEVIRQISAFQNAAKNYAAVFEAEKGAYVRCLKLRCLPGELLARLSHMIEP
uniref:Ras GEF n=2 Tax=Kalmanozyma brasiliensis (strain GHG001) TaxID=1365824 RepID=V5EF51_KALBG